MTQINIIRSDSLDYDEFVDAQEDAFASHFRKYDVDMGFLNKALFQWRFAAPLGHAKVAVAYEGDSMVAVVPAIPLTVGNNAHRTTAWRAVDIATRPAGRGKGLYTKLLNALIEDLSAGEMLAATPNANATPGFRKVGAIDSQYAATWARLVLPGSARYDDTQRIVRLPQQAAAYLDPLLQQSNRYSFVRDVNYLNWRYSDHPDHDYHVHVIDEGPKENGIVVFRQSEAYGRQVLLILELWTSSGRVSSQLMRRAARYCRGQKIRYILTVNSMIGHLAAARHGFVEIPKLLVPKQQYLRGVPSDDVSRQMLESPWNIQMGDLFLEV